MLCLISVGSLDGRRYARNKKLGQAFAYEVKSRADLECTTYVCSIEPGHSSGQEDCAANMRSVLMFKGFLGNSEEPFSVHEWSV